MLRSLLVVAPHPDDETLGCGGTILWAKEKGFDINWLIVTSMAPNNGFSQERVARRRLEIETVSAALGVKRRVELDHPTATLDAIPKQQLIREIGDAVSETGATDIFLPFRRDAHSDHAAVFDAGTACTKWFRYPTVRRVLAYETPSETEFDIAPDSSGFRPNIFIDISDWLETKIEIAKMFESEIGTHPFPRSILSIRALATLRGATSGFTAAESFMLLRARDL